MEFYGLDKDFIKEHSALMGDRNQYKFSLGNPVSVMTRNKRNANKVLAGSLSDIRSADKMMTWYCPTNVIYFDGNLLDDDMGVNNVSLLLNNSKRCVCIGRHDRYPIKRGVLSFSGKLSANMMVDSDICVCGNSQLSKSAVMREIRVLSVGILGDNLFGLFFIPKKRGLAIECNPEEQLGYSVNTWRLLDCGNWNKVAILDWFMNDKVECFN